MPRQVVRSTIGMKSAESGESSQYGSHPSGKKRIAYITDRKQRTDRYSARKINVVKNLKEIHVQTGCEIHLVMKSAESGKITRYDSVEISKRTVGTQCPLRKGGSTMKVRKTPDVQACSTASIQSNLPTTDTPSKRHGNSSTSAHPNNKRSGQPSTSNAKTKTNLPAIDTPSKRHGNSSTSAHPNNKRSRQPSTSNGKTKTIGHHPCSSAPPVSNPPPTQATKCRPQEELVTLIMYHEK